MNRRYFLQTGAAGVAAGMMSWSAAASPIAWLQSPATRYLPTGFRWTGAGVEAIPFRHAKVGDFAVFALMQRHRPMGPLDLFIRDIAPTGHRDPTFLRPMGRYASMAQVHAAMALELRQLVRSPPSKATV